MASRVGFGKPELVAVAALAAGAVALGIIRSRRRDDRVRPIGQMAAWRKETAARDGQAVADAWADAVQQRYAELVSAAKLPQHPALRKHLEENILTGLAAYTVSRERGMSQEQALARMRDLNVASSRAERKMMELLGRLPFFYEMLRRLLHRIMTRDYPPEGWNLEWVEVSDERLAFNMHSCFYLETYKAYGAPELAPLACEVDDLHFDGAWPTVRWERSGTLARGDKVCDFCYRRVTTSSN
jgi:hypothetical protein